MENKNKNLERLYSISLDQYNDLEDLVQNNRAIEVKEILERILSRHLECLQCIENEIDGEGECTFGC